MEQSRAQRGSMREEENVRRDKKDIRGRKVSILIEGFEVKYLCVVEGSSRKEEKSMKFAMSLRDREKGQVRDCAKD